MGTLTDISERLNVTHGAVHAYLERNPKMKLLQEKKRMSNIDVAEKVLFKHLKGTDKKLSQDSAKYITSRLGKNQGWVEKNITEVQGDPINNIKLEIIDKTEDVRTNTPDNKAV